MDKDIIQDHGDSDDILESLSHKDERDVVETPLRARKLSLNPGYEELPQNPLCPVCEEQIRSVSNDSERRFKCGCDDPWQFTFDPIDE